MRQLIPPADFNDGSVARGTAPPEDCCQSTIQIYISDIKQFDKVVPRSLRLTHWIGTRRLNCNAPNIGRFQQMVRAANALADFSGRLLPRKDDATEMDSLQTQRQM
jgi:predicted Abi (CAAX) family protease